VHSQCRSWVIRCRANQTIDGRLSVVGPTATATAPTSPAIVPRVGRHARPFLNLAAHAVLDPYNPTGSTMHVNFNTSKSDRWETDARRCHINWVILDSDWEGEFCRVAELHPKVRAYVKNHNLGLEVPYRYGSEMRRYIPDFIVLVDDGHGDNDLLHLCPFTNPSFPLPRIVPQARISFKTSKAGTKGPSFQPCFHSCRSLVKWTSE
jgi:hypothetical protein